MCPNCGNLAATSMQLGDIGGFQEIDIGVGSRSNWKPQIRDIVEERVDDIYTDNVAKKKYLSDILKSLKNINFNDVSGCN